MVGCKLKFKKNTMKKYLCITVTTMIFTFSACKKDSTESVSTVENVSYPAINLKGAIEDSIMFIPLGGTYAEAGATLIDDITHVHSDITPERSEININQTGVYYVTYRAHNKNGFETVRTRIVVIYNPAVNPEDFTGTYAHTNGVIVQVNQLAPRLFSCNDIYGTFVIEIPGYFVDYGDSLYIPVQPIDPSLGNEIHGTGEKSGAPGSYVLDFYGLIRDGNERPRTLTEQ
jgi:Domain of unknown function (DUF5011)